MKLIVMPVTVDAVPFASVNVCDGLVNPTLNEPKLLPEGVSVKEPPPPLPNCV